ncbi:protein transport protein S31 [Teratosphaeriaceae sp. CCFEE 6253]|nr:protein transport protein S31 [Teratosphaeriaceae sp. CCFEE 6253]
MVALRTLQRTAVFAWCPRAGPPLLVTGTRTGAVSEDFSDETKLELWDLRLDQAGLDSADLTPIASLTTDSGFNDISWSVPSPDHPLGLIAGALDNGAVEVWDAEKLRSGEAKSAQVTRTSKHSGSVKALQWNPFRPSMLASVGAKGEIYLYDFASNPSSPSSFRLGASAARADDIECLDWNKQDKTQHILATGSSGGFVTVWDVKQKRDILTLNNSGRKAVSAVAWDPEESTKLATATGNDADPAVYLWSLRNAEKPEHTLQGHELGVLGLSWCIQEPELLLSCGKDNQTLCWNARTGEKYGGFAAGSNWAFQTSWHPRNPALIASASFDGKILITSTQATNGEKNEQEKVATNAALDGEDFFAKAQTQEVGISFSIPKAPRYLARPASVAFGFGGKLVRVGVDRKTKKSRVSVETFAVDSSIGEAAEEFERKLKGGDLASICESKIEEAKTEEEKADWRVIETLNAGRSRKKLREYMGFADNHVDELGKKTDSLSLNGDGAKTETNGERSDEDFFGNGNPDDDDSFLANLASTKGAKTNNPFSIYTASETPADKSITRALLLGNFPLALDICLKEDRMSDAFMIAVCGGQSCIDKAQTAYLKKKAKGPNYLRLLASIVGKNLWDVVHNADLDNWREVMATLCTYADEAEFADLCEALGDRLAEGIDESGDENAERRRDASFCYLAGSKLEKVVVNWVQELREQQKSALESAEEEGDEFAVHARCLQAFVEKVSVFRQITGFRDAEMGAQAEWKLAPLYALYAEYAEILASHGQLASAERYLALLPPKFEGAEAAQGRVKQATKKAAHAAAARQPAGNAASVRQAAATLPGRPPSILQPTNQPLVGQARNATPGPYNPVNPAKPAPSSNPYAPAAPLGGQNAYAPPAPAQPNPYAQPAPPAPANANPYAPPANNYAPTGPSYGGYQPPPQQASLPPPPRAGTASPAVQPAASQAKKGDWNDMPANFFPARPQGGPSRRSTPAPPTVGSPFPNAQPPAMSSPPLSSYGQRPPQQQAPLPPPPKAGEMQRVLSPPQQPAQMQRPSSRASNAYAPPQGSQPSTPGLGSTLPTPAPPPTQRGASPYQPPPATSHAAPSSRYAPAPGAMASPAPGSTVQRQVAPNPYAQPQGTGMGYGGPPQQGQQGGHVPPQGPPGPYAPPQSGTPYGQGPPQQQGPPPAAAPPPPRGPPKAAQAPPPARGGAPSVQALPQTASDTPPPPSAPQQQQQQQPKPKYPRGDRSHIPASARPIVGILTPEIARIQGVAPQAFKPQVEDMEKRINILFDHLNNEDLLTEGTVGKLGQIADAVGRQEWEGAAGLFAALQGALGPEEGGVWVVGIKRLINIGKATSGR